MHLATTIGCKEAMQLLIASKADVNAKDYNGATPLYLATKYGRTEAVHLLIASKADIN